MALTGVTIDWPTGVINVPRADLTLIQSVPTEIRGMDLNEFRLKLKELEETVDGMVFLKTHDHNTEILLGGITYARTIEILEPYTITFEDGQYAVNLFGANSNVGDRVNVNQVSVRSNNSAGLITSPEIQYAAFNGGVHTDLINGVAGTIYPRGTERVKSNNIPDTLLIADDRGFKKIYLYSDLILDDTYDLEDFRIIGESYFQTNIIINSSPNISGSTFENCTISGTTDGEITITSCKIVNLNNMSGQINNCYLNGTITLGNLTDSHIDNCSQFDFNATPEINMSGSGQNLVVVNYTGRLLITNLTDNNNSVGIGLDAGQVILDSTSVTAGTIHVSGDGEVVDENGTFIPTGIWNGGVNVINDVISKGTIADAVWEENLGDHTSSGTTGNALRISEFNDVVSISTNGVSGTTYPIGTHQHPVNNITDAITIANQIGTINLSFTSPTFTIDENVSGFSLQSQIHSNLTILSGATTFFTGFEDVAVSGALNGYTVFHDASVSNGGITGFYGLMDNTVISGDITISSDNTKNAVILDSYIGDVTAPPTFDCGGDGAKVSLRGLTGALLFVNKTGTSQPMFIDLYSARVGFDSTVTAGNITVRGVGYIYQDDSTNTTFDLKGLMSKSTISVAVWDEPLTKITHNLPFSAGRRLRALSSIVLLEDDVLSGTTNTITLLGASTTDGAYDPSMITITDGLGAGQTRLILQYNGAEMTAVVDRNWKTIPDDTSTYLISANPGREHVNEGLAQSGTTSTITLNPLASPFDDAYNGQIVFLRSGIGEDQASRVLSYNGTTKVATLYNDWNVIPDNTSAYVMLPTGGIEEGFVADAVWNKTLP